MKAHQEELNAIVMKDPDVAHVVSSMAGSAPAPAMPAACSSRSRIDRSAIRAPTT
jgi:hypothetical protein